MTNQTIDTRNLVTEYLRNIELPSDFDLPFLGRRNLMFLSHYYLQKGANTASRAGSFRSETNPSEDNKNPLLQEEDEELYETIDTIIVAARRHAERKPLFATLRYDRWFDNDDEVVCFIQDDGDQTLLKKNVFVTGEVFADWTQQEGYVSVLANEKVHADYILNERGLRSISRNPHKLSFTTHDPRIMKVGEYNYLKNHPDYLKMWITCHPSLPQFNPESMLQAFAEQQQ